MSFFKRLFGGGNKETEPQRSDATIPEDPANDPNMIRVFDKYGQEFFITREAWRDDVMMGTIKDAWNNPDKLFNLIVQALQDEFVEEVVPASEQLHKIDPTPSRGATILGIAYMETGRLDKAERVLSGHISKHGEDGVVLTNLAKIYSKKGDEELSENTLWRALEVDPNQDNGMGWYEVIHRERDGDEAGLEALRRIAAIPGSWRAQLWLARSELEKGNIKQALDFYNESLSKTEKPVPEDLLMQMSGDLGNNGRLHEIIEWVEPHYDAELHGLQVGNNLIKANLELGDIEEARKVLDQLYALKRQDWNETLRYWDTELAKARIQAKSDPNTPLQVTILDIEGPLWMRDRSPFKDYLPLKASGMQKIGVFGGTITCDPKSDKPQQQMADGPGRMSRALPLLLTEWLHINTRTGAHCLIPWAQGQGFAVLGKPYSDADLCNMAENQKQPLDFIVSIGMDVLSEPWEANLKMLRVADVLLIGEMTCKVDSKNPGPGVENLLTDFRKMIRQNTDFRILTRNSWYDIPQGTELSDYLLRLEQSLAVSCTNLDFLEGGGLSGEREIVDGAIRLCVRNPNNETTRMLLVHTLRQIKKSRPEMLPEFKEKVDSLQRELPTSEEVDKIASTAISEVFS